MMPPVSHLMSFEADMTYHIPHHGEPSRKREFAPNLACAIRQHAAAIRDQTLLNTDPQLAFLSDGDGRIGGGSRRAANRPGHPPSPTRSSAGGEALDAAAIYRGILPLSKSEPVLPIASSPARRNVPGGLGSSSSSSMPRLTPINGSVPPPMPSSATDRLLPSTSLESKGGVRRGGDPPYPQLPARRPPLAPMVATCLGSCPPRRLAAIESAAITFDRGQQTLLHRALSISSALIEEPGSVTKELATFDASCDLARHRFFVPEKAAEGPGRIIGRGREEKVEEKVLWTLEASIWGPRKKWCDALDFYDTTEILKHRLDAVWDRTMQHTGVRKYIYRWAEKGRNGNLATSTASSKDLLSQVSGKDLTKQASSRQVADPADGGEGKEEVRDAVEEVYEVMQEMACFFFNGFDFYSALTGFSGVLSLNNYTQFVEDCRLSDQKSEFFRKSDIDRLFISADTASKQIDAETETDGMNRSKALSVDEFMNCIISLATMRYVMPGELPNIAEALRRLFIVDIKGRCDPSIFLDANAFRRDCCYNEETDAVFRTHEGTLRSLYGELAIKRGPAKRLLTADAFLRLMKRLDLIGIDLTERDVALAFSCSRMVVGMPYSITGQLKNKHLPFEGFLEAICRIAGLKALPTDEEVEASGLKDGGQYLAALKADSPDAYSALVATRSTLWGSPPRQKMSRCVAHLIGIIFYKIEDVTLERHDVDLCPKDIVAFFKGFDDS